MRPVAQLRSLLRRAHRNFVFSRAMKRFLKNPSACRNSESRVMRDLVYGWGNESWSAHPEYLGACIQFALVVKGPILECGSGLSTVLLAAVAKKRETEDWALEHTPEGAAQVEGELEQYRQN